MAITKKYFFPVLIVFVIFLNSLIFLPKYGSWGGAVDVEYQSLAVNLFEGKGFSLGGGKTMFREPAYPFFLFLNYKIFGMGSGMVIIEQIILFLLALYLVYLIASKIFSSLVAKMSVLITALVPVFLIYTTDLSSEILALFFVLLSVFLFVESIEKKNLVFPILSGLFLGLLVLTKSIFIFIPVLLIPVYFIAKSKSALKKSLLFILFFLITVSPWLCRNYANFDRIVVADRGGMVFYLHAVKSERSYSELKDFAVSALFGGFFVKIKNPDFEIREAAGINAMNKKREELLTQGYSSSEADKIMWQEAKELFFKNPVKNIYIGFLEFNRLNAPMVPRDSIVFSFSENTGETAFDKFLRGTIIIILRLIWWAILALALYGIIRAIKKKKTLAIPLIIFIVYLNAIIFLLEGVPRFAFPIYPLYFTFFAFSVRNLVRKNKDIYI